VLLSHFVLPFELRPASLQGADGLTCPIASGVPAMKIKVSIERPWGEQKKPYENRPNL
jgi:hypothetical protein